MVGAVALLMKRHLQVAVVNKLILINRFYARIKRRSFYGDEARVAIYPMAHV